RSGVRADGRKRLAKCAEPREDFALRQVRLLGSAMADVPSASPPGALIRSRPTKGSNGERPATLAPRSEGAMNDGPMSPEQTLARRTILKGASLGVGAGLAFALSAQAQSTGAGEGSDAPIWSGEYWAKKGEVALNLWRKRVGAPKAGETPLPILLLVHGSSNSARSSYDLTVPGRGEYSLMNAFARYGYDVWTMDHDGYGHSGSSGNNSDIASSVEDLKAAIPVVARETGQTKMHFYGTSSGAIRAAAFAQAEP